MKLLPLRPRRSASPPPRSASPPQKICFAPVVPLRPRRNSALPPSFCLAPNGGTAHSRHENRLQNNNKGCAAKFKVAHAPANILDHLSAKWRCTNPSHSKVYPYLTAHDFRVDCELCRHWGLSSRTGAKQNCAGGVEERRGRSRFFAGAKQNGAGAKQNSGGEEEGVSWGPKQHEPSLGTNQHLPSGHAKPLQRVNKVNQRQQQFLPNRTESSPKTPRIGALEAPHGEIFASPEISTAWNLPWRARCRVRERLDFPRGGESSPWGRRCSTAAIFPLLVVTSLQGRRCSGCPSPGVVVFVWETDEL
ncbi:hypothetical protein Bbelb_067930 [Branchiostoma belcheri]|nr:hypothetical protein Bbelb_067930 [Branchiostoma belcheri]